MLISPIGAFAAPAARSDLPLNQHGAMIAPPWCGTPPAVPEWISTLPDGSNPGDPPGSFAHIPVYAFACTLADIQARSNGRMDDQGLRSIGGRQGLVSGYDQRARHAPAAEGLPDLAEHPQDRPD